MIICAKPWPVLSIKQNVDIFSNLGYKKIRYDPNTTIFKKNRTGTPLEIFKRDFDIIQNVGLSIEEFHSYAVAFDEFKKRVDVYIEMMQIADVRFYVQHMSKEMMQHKDELSEIIKKFKNAGIYFCVENECVFEGFSAYTLNFEVMDNILETFPDVQVCLDIGHAFEIGIDPYEYYKRYKDKIKVIHLHDFKDGKDHLVPFTGELLQSPIVSELKKFKGPIVLELSMHALDLLKDKYGEAMNLLSKHLLK